MFISIRLNLIRFDLICVELIVAVFFFSSFFCSSSFLIFWIGEQKKTESESESYLIHSIFLFCLFVDWYSSFSVIYFFFFGDSAKFLFYFFYFSLNLICHCCSANWCLLFFSLLFLFWPNRSILWMCSLQARNKGKFKEKFYFFLLLEYHFQLTVFYLVTRLRQWHDHSVCVWEIERESDECKWKEKVRIKIHH